MVKSQEQIIYWCCVKLRPSSVLFYWTPFSFRLETRFRSFKVSWRSSVPWKEESAESPPHPPYFIFAGNICSDFEEQSVSTFINPQFVKTLKPSTNMNIKQLHSLQSVAPPASANQRLPAAVSLKLTNNQTDTLPVWPLFFSFHTNYWDRNTRKVTFTQRLADPSDTWWTQLQTASLQHHAQLPLWNIKIFKYNTLCIKASLECKPTAGRWSFLYNPAVSQAGEGNELVHWRRAGLSHIWSSKCSILMCF